MASAVSTSPFKVSTTNDYIDHNLFSPSKNMTGTTESSSMIRNTTSVAQDMTSVSQNLTSGIQNTTSMIQNMMLTIQNLTLAAQNLTSGIQNSTSSPVPNITSTTVNSTTPFDHQWETAEYDLFVMFNLIAPVLFGVISFVGIIENGLVVFLYCKIESRRRQMNTFLIFVLAVTDIWLLVVVTPLNITEQLWTYPLGDFWCKLSNYTLYCAPTVSLFLLCIMSADRFFAFLFPIQASRSRTTTCLIIAVAVLGVIACLINTPVFFFFGKFFDDDSDGRVICGEKNVEIYPSLSLIELFTWLFFIVCYAIPTLAICGMYICIFVKLIMMKMSMVAIDETSLKRNNLRAAKFLLIVIFAHLVCYTPKHLFLLFQNKFDSFEYVVFESFFVTSNCLLYLNSCLNPFLYALMSNDYRNAIIKNMLKFRQQRDHIIRTNVDDGTINENKTLDLTVINEATNENAVKL